MLIRFVMQSTAVCVCVCNIGFFSFAVQPMEVFVDDETKLTLHGLQQYYCKLKDSEKNRKLFDLLDVLEFNQVQMSQSLFYTRLLYYFNSLWNSLIRKCSLVVANN